MSVETLKSAGSSCVVIHHHGAHITSWKDSAGREMIYTSPTAIYNEEKAIRGGIPICFPQFGPNGPLQQHGFARNKPWTVDDNFTTTTTTCRKAIRFILRNDVTTESSAWPFSFSVSYTVTLADDGNSLTLDMVVINTDDQPFTFTTALHSYFTCQASTTTLPDFNNVHYKDSIDPTTTTHKLQSGLISFGEEVDRVYFDTPNTITIPSASLTINKTNFPEAVVWNPYIEKAAAMGDLPDNAWQDFICIEPARIAEPAVVQPNQNWTAQCVLTSSNISV